MTILKYAGILFLILSLAVLIAWQCVLHKIRNDCRGIRSDDTVALTGLRFRQWNVPVFNFIIRHHPDAHVMGSDYGSLDVFGWKAEIFLSG